MLKFYQNGYLSIFMSNQKHAELVTYSVNIFHMLMDLHCTFWVFGAYYSIDNVERFQGINIARFEGHLTQCRLTRDQKHH